MWSTAKNAIKDAAEPNETISETIIRIATQSKIQHKTDANQISLNEWQQGIESKFTDLQNEIREIVEAFPKQLEEGLEAIRKSLSADLMARGACQDVQSIDFVTAYKKLEKGRRFVKIYEMRTAMNITDDEFDQTVRDLRDEGKILLMQTDWTNWTQEQRDQSFTDENGVTFSIVQLY
jgi:hypothetical protein